MFKMIVKGLVIVFVVFFKSWVGMLFKFIVFFVLRWCSWVCMNVMEIVLNLNGGFWWVKVESCCRLGILEKFKMFIKWVVVLVKNLLKVFVIYCLLDVIDLLILILGEVVFFFLGRIFFMVF